VIQDDISSLHRSEEAAVKTIRKLRENIAKYETQIAAFDGDNPELEAAPLINQKVQCSKSTRNVDLTSVAGGSKPPGKCTPSSI
jgi:hypothetical protein